LSWGACPGDVLETPGPRGPGPRLVGALRGRGLACVAEGLGLRAPARGGEVEPPPVRLGLGEAAEPRKALTRSVLCAVPGQPWPRDAWPRLGGVTAKRARAVPPTPSSVLSRRARG